ncbi:WbuC family cupin fold metalloprotein [Zymobacter sp. IVIA_12111.31 C1]|uniref:WbuC family cupin fold metalloprotein n=1 Tax=Zymobacter sp. IVIA_12111.31 C1 TaxID=3394854 RepID=UPI0039C06DB9
MALTPCLVTAVIMDVDLAARLAYLFQENDMRILNDQFRDALYRQADASPRLRAHERLHEKSQDPVQRIVVGLRRGTYIPPHKHPAGQDWELFQVVDGDIKLLIFNDEGMVKQTLRLGPDNDTFAVQMPPNTVHSMVCMSDHALFIEVKQGPYREEDAKLVMRWAPNEGDEQAADYVKRLEEAATGNALTR